MKRHIKIYKACLQTTFANITAYRADFVISSFITLISSVVMPLVTLLIYNNGASFPEWTMWEVLLIQSVYIISNNTAAAIFNGIIWSTMDYIRNGNFETVLIKPVSPLFYLTASTFSPDCLISVGGGITMLVISIVNIGGAGAMQWLQFLLLFVSGTAVLCGVYLIMAAITFKWVGNSRIPEIFNSVKSFGTYPASIFPKALQIITAVIVPVAMVGFFPASALLGRAEPIAFIAILPCVFFMLLGIMLYKKMIKLYEGVGG